MGKLLPIDKVIEKITDGSSIMVGGFIGVGIPELLLSRLADSRVKDLTIIANDSGFPGRGIGKLIDNKQIAKLVASHIGTNPETGRQLNSGETVVELIPQGTLAERIRSAGAGLGGILSPTGIGTVVENNKQKIIVGDQEYLLELPIKADFALIKAYQADAKGNLVFRRAARNFNPIMATAADYVIAEVEHYQRESYFDPDQVLLPGIFIDAIVRGEG